MQVRLIAPSDENTELQPIIKVLMQLRPQYNEESISTQINKQRELGYHLAYVEDKSEIICVAGFVFGEKLAWGKYIYVDDLITDSSSRSSGAGALMIDWLKMYCAETNCDQLHLDSGIQRTDAHRFYKRHDFDISSYHFTIILNKIN